MELEYFCEPPFFISRTFYSSTLGFVFRQTKALFKGMALPLGYLQPIAYIYEWVDSMEYRVWHGWTSFVITKLEYANRAAIVTLWRCYFFFCQYEWNIFSHVLQNSYYCRLYVVIWLQKMQKDLEMLKSTSIRITQATKWACWDTGCTSKVSFIKIQTNPLYWGDIWQGN